MFKLRLAFALTVIVLAGFTASVVLSQSATSRNYTEVQQEQLIRAEDGWLVSFKILNHENESKTYTVTSLIDDNNCSEEITVPRGKFFTFTHHVQPAEVEEESISFAIYMEGEQDPIEKVVYHLK